MDNSPVFVANRHARFDNNSGGRGSNGTVRILIPRSSCAAILSAPPPAVIDFGQAVKDLAANGIFPGELLPKNFGVTRHGRIACYDYDELSLLTDFTFREMPAGSDEDEYADEAWFGVGPRDVFPVELSRFLGLTPDLYALLGRSHGDLYRAAFWNDVQARVREGEIIDIFPYPESRRLRPG